MAKNFGLGSCNQDIKAVVNLKILVFQAQYDRNYGRHSSRGRSRPNGSYGSYNPSMDPSGADEDTKLKNLIREIRDSVGTAKGFWTRLPYDLCEDDSLGSGDEFVAGGRGRKRSGRDPECWNGRDAGIYRNPIVSDGLVNQETNPEVEVDISRPDIDINEQIFALKLMTKNLEKAYNGQNVDWPTQRGEKIAFKY